ncbi:MAG: PfkB family carbohydrate kinase [Rubrimonas sp.]
MRTAVLPKAGASVHVRLGSAGPGGKGLNQAAAMVRAGVAVRLIAGTGRDARAAMIREAIAPEGLAEGLIPLEGVATDWSCIVVGDDGENMVLTTAEAAAALTAGTIAQSLEAARPGDLLVVQGNLTVESTAATLNLARERGMRTALNPSPAQAGFAPLLALADMLFVNCEEAEAFGGADALAATCEQLVLTQGAEGAALREGARTETISAVRTKVADPTGAGDTFMGVALAASQGRGWKLDAAALAAGARAAALTVARDGAFAALPTRAEMTAVMSRT